jgi:hypothetical protein
MCTPIIINIKIKLSDMKKCFSLLAVLFIVLLIFASCKKCSQCVAKDKVTHNQVNSSDEFCGSNKAVTEKESAYKDAWGSIYDVQCSTK